MKFLFTCGGTGGHIYPAVSVAEEILKKDPDAEFLFIGAEGMMEMDLVPACGYDIKALRVTNLSRGKSFSALFHNLKSIFNVITAIFKAMRLIRDFGPDAVIGTGGYVCFPVIFAAHLLGIRTFLHESNSVPGLTTKMLSRTVDAIFLGYRESMQYYPAEKAVYAGTPVRRMFEEKDESMAFEKLGTDSDLPLVVSVWGSLGSGYMNECFSKFVSIMPEGRFRLLHVTGKRYYDQYGYMADLDIPVVRNKEFIVKDFLYDLPVYLSAASLVICRAGASTLAELAYLGKPAIIVPSPNVTNNHQDKNARVFEKKGAAIVLSEGKFTPEDLLASIQSVLSTPEKAGRMSMAMSSFCVPDSAAIIAEMVLSML